MDKLTKIPDDFLEEDIPDEEYIPALRQLSSQEIKQLSPQEIEQLLYGGALSPEPPPCPRCTGLGEIPGFGNAWIGCPDCGEKGFLDKDIK